MRRVLALGAAVVALLVIGLIYMLREAPRPVSGTSPRDASPASTATDVTPTPSAPATPPNIPPATPAERPPPPEIPAPGRDAEGRIVRDHRDEPGPTGPPSPLTPMTLGLARQVLGPLIKACKPLYKPRPDGQPGRMVVHAQVRVAGGRVTAGDVTVTDEAELGPGYVDCVKQAYAALSTDPPDGQKDGEDLVHMPWTIP